MIRSVHLCTVVVLIVVAGPIAAVSAAEPYQIGDNIIVSNSTRLKVGKTDVAAVVKGEGLTVEGVNGDWLWVSTAGINGYIHSGNVQRAFPIRLWLEKREPQSSAAKLHWDPKQLNGHFSEGVPTYWVIKLQKPWEYEPDVLPAGTASFAPLPQQPPLKLKNLESGRYAVCMRMGIRERGDIFHPLDPKLQKSNWVMFQVTGNEEQE